MPFLFWLGVVTLAIYILIALDFFAGNRSLRALREVAPEMPADSPRVSVVVAARNEERNLRAALASLLRLDYPDWELLVVDDRSDDATGAILDAMAQGHPHLRVLHLRELPAGWIGKNHALWAGSRQATGEILLFTDADIVMEPTTLRRAVNYLRESGCDHLVATPSMTMPTTFLQMFGTSFILFFALFTRPWKARDPRSRRHIGVGAFNMVRRAAYDAVGGHATIRLRPDDDLKLGKILKRGGFRQDAVFGPDFLGVEWYASVREVIRGLEKNAFAGCDYRIPLAVFGSLFHLLFTVWPYLAVLVTGGATRLVYAAVVVVLTLLFADCASFHRSRRWYAVGLPVCALLFVWIVLRTMILNLWQGGVTWRGTFYPLEELRANRV